VPGNAAGTSEGRIEIGGDSERKNHALISELSTRVGSPILNRTTAGKKKLKRGTAPDVLNADQHHWAERGRSYARPNGVETSQKSTHVLAMIGLENENVRDRTWGECGGNLNASKADHARG